MLYKVESKKSVAEAGRSLEVAAQRSKFGVMVVHDLQAKLREKGVNLDHECWIYEVCNPQQAKTVLETSPEISTALPCRISIYPERDSTILATILPTIMIGMYQAHGLKAVAQQVEDTMIRMMDEAAR